MDVKLEPSPAVQDKNIWIIIKYHQNGEHYRIIVEYVQGSETVQM